MNGGALATLERCPMPTDGLPPEYVETIGAFLASDDEPERYLIPELLPEGVIMLMHGEPRARKSLAAFELALSAATGTAPFGLARFTPIEAVPVLYVMEEDPRGLTKKRLGPLVRARCGAATPDDTLHVIIRRGVNLDDPACVKWLIVQLRKHGSRLLVLDAARRLSAKTDEGPGKVRELIAVLRTIVNATGCAVVIVHHDTKPPQSGQDQRRRSQRASGGDWFAASECPVHVEKLSRTESLVFPEDYKFGSDPAPFTFMCEVSAGLVTRLVGTDTTTDEAERAGVKGKILDWLRVNASPTNPATKTAMKKAGLGRWETIEAALEVLQKDGSVEAVPGRKAGSLRFYVPSPTNGDALTGRDGE